MHFYEVSVAPKRELTERITTHEVGHQEGARHDVISNLRLFGEGRSGNGRERSDVCTSGEVHAADSSVTVLRDEHLEHTAPR